MEVFMMNDSVVEIEKMKDSFSNAKMDNELLRFCVVESISEKRYIVFDSANNFEIITIPFGGLVAPTLNKYMKFNPESIYHESFKANYKEEYGSEAIPYDELLDCFSRCPKEVDRLIGLVKKRNTAKCDDKVALKCSYLKEWKKYRYIIYHKFWADMIELSRSGKENYEFLRDIFTEKEIDEMIESNHMEAMEISETHHKIIRERCFVPYDEIYFNLFDKWECGKVWFSIGLGQIFIRDLYHVLVDNAVESPRVCPRCGQMYYLNNYKSKYCPECKAHASDIRKENLKKNPARYLHKRVWDKINAHKDKYDKDFLNAFMNESNYYWYKISGKKSGLERKETYLDIDTIEKYQEWLENKLNSL